MIKENDEEVSELVKLQGVSRKGKKNLLYSIHVPLSVIGGLDLKKGDLLELTLFNGGLIVTRKK